MNPKVIIPIVLALASPVLTAHAQPYINTDISLFSIGNSATIAFDGSSLQLGGTLYAFGGTGIGVPTDSAVTPYTTTLSGLSSTQTPDSISGYLNLAGYQFNLSSIQETVVSGDVQVLGYGTLIDTSSVYSPTAATLTFSSSSSSPTTDFSGTLYAGGLAAVPEPGILSLVGVGATALTFIRRRQ